MSTEVIFYHSGICFPIKVIIIDTLNYTQIQIQFYIINTYYTMKDKVYYSALFYKNDGNLRNLHDKWSEHVKENDKSYIDEQEQNTHN